MNLLLLGVGKLRPEFRAVADDYLRRLGRNQQVTEHQIREAGHRSRPELRRAEEDKRLLRHLPSGMPVILLDIDGDAWSSVQLAERLQQWRLAATDRALVIGGAEGVGIEIQQRAGERWSLGPLTLPHQLARVIVLEQLYRADSILAGTPYHRGNR